MTLLHSLPALKHSIVSATTSRMFVPEANSEVVLFDFGRTRLVSKRAFCVGASFFFCESDRGLFVGRVSKQQMTLTLKVLSSVGPSITPGPESRSLHSASSAVRGSHHRVADASGVRNFVSWWCASFLRTVPAGASATAPATR